MVRDNLAALQSTHVLVIGVSVVYTDAYASLKTASAYSKNSVVITWIQIVMYLLFYRHEIEKRLGLANPDKNQLNVTFSLLCKLVLI